METRFKKKSQIIDIGVTAVGAVLSVCIMLYGVSHFGLGEAWPELVLNLCYIACLVMMGMYFFKRLDSQRFNYWSSVCAGVTVLLRDILFPPPLESYPIHLVCLTLSVTLLIMFTFFYARKDWKRYTKRNLWLLFIIDTIIAGLIKQYFRSDNCLLPVYVTCFPRHRQGGVQNGKPLCVSG